MVGSKDYSFDVLKKKKFELLALETVGGKQEA